ncbi:ribose-phosphate diphosphokinase [Archaeoglobus profundus]|uniref:Ribose-phosphate pyrophosphokinase n=1 Tax=Archaeoglobus profundus (strain DSM 5631 / JCM 9629 / NBRC 100127 / Av18) TaxID=572546 RepID=D2RHP3_ARCPA|nr:ribose-phosphate diphosphokinase [Archaeoglobus profundus]ADB57818.1 ribose-phosphate pyrophosphokinase [Archaeoglobus profundus DSM 5631]
MKVVPGKASPLLAKRIADRLGCDLAKTTYKVFPDGELYVRVEKVDEAVVVQSINSNEDLVQLMLIFDALKDAEIKAVIPYMGYARQDREFNEGEAVSIRAIAKLIEGYADKVITVNIHSEKAKSYFKNLVEVDAMPLIGEYYKGKNVVMISPDLGSFNRVKVASSYAGCEFDYLEKRRISAEEVEIKPKSLNVEGKDVVIVDDIISTGGTIVEATKVLKALGAKSVECACVHAVLAGDALNKLFNAGVKRVIATDTIEKSVSVISVADEIAKVLRS